MQTNKLTCSVAIGTYNGEKYITEQLRSIENQTVLPDEVIIFDDCSTDNTVEVVKEYIKNSNLNILFSRNSQNLGFRRNYEQIYSACSKDIVFLCDQDDVWVNTKIDTFLKEFQKDDKLVYAFSDAYVTDENLNIVKDSEWTTDWMQYDRQSFFDFVQTRYFPLGFQVVVKREFLHQIFPLLADPDGWIGQCAATFGNIKAIPDKLVYYRRHSQATSMAHRKSTQNYFSIIKKMFTTRYQEYFTYPNAELKTYSRIYEFAERNDEVNTKEIKQHLVYLETLKGLEYKSVFCRLKGMKMLKENNCYFQYRGNKKTYFLDSLYMIVSSFRRKEKC